RHERVVHRIGDAADVLGRFSFAEADVNERHSAILSPGAQHWLRQANRFASRESSHLPSILRNTVRMSPDRVLLSIASVRCDQQYARSPDMRISLMSCLGSNFP